MPLIIALLVAGLITLGIMAFIIWVLPLLFFIVIFVILALIIYFILVDNKVIDITPPK